MVLIKWGIPYPWGYPNSWMVFVRENMGKTHEHMDDFGGSPISGNTLMSLEPH